jgi:hypothetical protein
MLQAIQPLDQGEIDCLSAEWLICALAATCGAGATLPAGDGARLAAALLARPDCFVSLCRSAALDPGEPGLLSCLLELLLSSGLPTGELGRAWAAPMMKLVEGRGSMVGLDRAALDELRIAMEGWPIHDPDWWRGLWEGMPLAEGGAELVLRAGLYGPVRVHG